MIDLKATRQAYGLPAPLTSTEQRLDAVLGVLGEIRDLLTRPQPDIGDDLIELTEPGRDLLRTLREPGRKPVDPDEPNRRLITEIEPKRTRKPKTT